MGYVNEQLNKSLFKSYLIAESRKSLKSCKNISNVSGYPQVLRVMSKQNIPVGIPHFPHWSPVLRGWLDNGGRSWWQTRRVERRFLIWRTFLDGSLRIALWSHHPHPQTLPCSAEHKMQKKILIIIFLLIRQEYTNLIYVSSCILLKCCGRFYV